MTTSPHAAARPAPMPSLFIPHGGGPCFFMPDPSGMWTGMRQFLEGVIDSLPRRPSAIVLVSGHWEEAGFAVNAHPAPSLIYDYYGFPPHTYQLTYPAAGDPVLAKQVRALLADAGFHAWLDPEHGFDHGMFIPLKVAVPDADIPVVQLSLDKHLDPDRHLAAGAALAPLRDQDVLIIGSGMSFHNMRAYGNPQATSPSVDFDNWLTVAAEADGPTRSALLRQWADTPTGRFAHPREEHLIPLMVAAGASDCPGQRIYHEIVMQTAISGYRFD